MEWKAHWETIYGQKRPEEVSWYSSHLDASLKFLAHAGLNPKSRIIDVGGGASTLVDDLIERGVEDITVLDISGHALAVSKERLGRQALGVNWMEADITRAQLPSEYYDFWHDRAVFHFLTNPADRRRYMKTMSQALKPSGQLILATFALLGPPRCSGLEVARYSPETLQAELGGAFELVGAIAEDHQTPFGAVQKFIYAYFRKVHGR